MAKKVAKLPFDPAIFLATVDSGRTLSDSRRNDVIFTQGDPADAVFYIKTGKVKITVISEQGKEAVLAVLGPDEFCGEGCLAGQTRRMATATAMSECEIMRLEKAAIIGVLHDEPGFPEMFVSHLLAAHDPGRGGLGRSTVQFKREALGTGSSFVGKFWQGQSTRAGYREGQPRDARGDDRNNTLRRKLFYEQVSKIGLD